VVDTETKDWEAYANPAVNATGGAGVQASQFIAEKGAQAVVSGDFGPNAYITLAAANLQMFLAPAGETLTGRQLLGRYQAGQLGQATAPTHRGLHGKGR